MAVAVVAVALALAIAVRSASARPGEPVPARPTAVATAVASGPLSTSPESPGPASPGPGAAGTTGGGPTSDGQELLVHVVGQVATPGVVRVPAGSRVADALERAGGALDSADLARVNLARPVVDGEQVVVPRPGETVAPAPGVGGQVGVPGGPGGAAGAGTPVRLNSADLAALDALPGIGPVLAQRILDWRREHGSFSSVDELGEVSGIGDKLLEQLRSLVTV